MKKIYYSMITLALLGVLTGCDMTDTTASAAAQNSSNSTPAAASPKTAALQTEDEKLYAQEVADAQKQDTETSDAVSDVSIDGDDRSGGGDVIKPDMKAGWYMRTIVTAILPDGTQYRHDSAGVFGELDESDDRRDRHDIESFGKAVLQTVFVNNRVNISKEYFSDYRTYRQGESKEVWTFLVKNETGTDLSQADLKIEVGDLYDVFKKEGQRGFTEKLASDQSKRNSLTLVDVDNRKTYSYDELLNTVLNMDGKHVRTFRWVLNGSVSSEDMEPRKVIDVMTTGGSSVFTPRNMAATGSSKFGLPPE